MLSLSVAPLGNHTRTLSLLTFTGPSMRAPPPDNFHSALPSEGLSEHQHTTYSPVYKSSMNLGLSHQESLVQKSRPSADKPAQYTAQFTKSNTLYSKYDRTCLAITMPSTVQSFHPRSPHTLPCRVPWSHPLRNLTLLAAIAFRRISAKHLKDLCVVLLALIILGRLAKEFLLPISVLDRKMRSANWWLEQMTKFWQGQESRRFICGSWYVLKLYPDADADLLYI